ncbi:unnamed protein product [Clonostachys rosea f. rosea IK726]|uniref:Aminoglycoside phosphotransferase domain-containing protein n=2 Tax=Bionectria ochroleuca TaxID=29856 RepID=A0A0B7K075_BIOOC|nr:unnamed protein product [Clonostachys rosea f. rosea IK726]
MSQNNMTEDEALSALMSYVFSGGLGAPTGKDAGCSLIEATPTSFSWSVALDGGEEQSAHADRYRINIDRQSGQISSLGPIAISETEQAEAIASATGQTLTSSTRFLDGAHSISYKVSVEENPDIAYLIHLRHHGNVASMESLITRLERTPQATNENALPIPAFFPIPGERERQESTGIGRQISLFVPGVLASTIYPNLSHEDKLGFIRKVALAFSASWNISLPDPIMIGGLHATTVGDNIILDVQAERHHGFGGPFPSVKEYLESHVKASFRALEKQQGIEEFKKKYVKRIGNFVRTRLHKISPIVEDVPIVVLHSNMGPHNIIVSSDEPTTFKAIIGWTCVASEPFLAVNRTVEAYFREPALNGFGPEYDRANELREAFWGTIPYWRRWGETDASHMFREWFRFGLFMKPEERPAGLPEAESQAFWSENVRVVEDFLDRYE